MGELSATLQAALSGRYAIERELGHGGMATVYLARDTKHDRKVAIKVLRPELAAILGAERFLQEIRITARLDHPHILTLIDSGESDGILWYVLPYVPRESLRERLDRQRQLGVEDALTITRQIGGALDYAHRQGVIHRDIKPENILLHEGEAMLADFGIALALREAGGHRLTETGLSLGTPQYMSPEQAMGDRDLDARSDIYSLGAVLYEMLAGEPPHTGATAQAIISKLLVERPTPLRTIRDTVPVSVNDAVAKALAKVPADRFASVSDFVAALSRSSHRVRSGRPRLLVAGGALAIAVSTLFVVKALHLTHRKESRSAAPPIRLSTTGFVRFPVLSPDGGLVAYANQACTEQGQCTIRLMVRETATEGSSALDSLRSGYLSPESWSPDGRRILYWRNTGVDDALYEVSRFGGAPVRIACCAAAYFSDKDTMLVVSARGDSSTWIETKLISTGEVVDSIPIHSSNIGSHHLAPIIVSPSGRWLVVSGDPSSDGTETIRLLDRRGHLRDSLAIPWSEVRWAPGSDALYYWQGTVAELGLDVPEGVLVRKEVQPGTGRIQRQADTVLSRLPVGPFSTPEFSIGGQGHSLAYAAAERPVVTMLLYDSRRSGQRPERLREVRPPTAVSPAFAPKLSPDGTRLGYAAVLFGETGQRYQVHVVGIANDKTLSVGSVLTELVDWGWRDNTRIWIAARTAERRIRIVVDSVGGEREESLATVDSTYFTSGWFGNGLLVSPAQNGDTVVTILPGSTTRKIGLPDAAGDLLAVAISPNGRELVTLGEPRTGSGWAADLCVGSLVNGGFKCFASPPALIFGSFLEWTDDGWIHLLAALRGDSGLRLYRFQASSDRLVPEPTPEAVPSGLRGSVVQMAMSRDGRRFLVTTTETPSSIWLVRDFDLAYRR